MDLPARLRAKNLTFTSLAEEVGADRVHLTAALMGQHPLPADLATKVADRLGLDADELQAIPTRGSFETLPPADPTIYRLYEVLQVYGPTIKALIHEDHGDGIMSAINFKLDVQSDERNGAPRVRIVLDGKFLPYAWE